MSKPHLHLSGAERIVVKVGTRLLTHDRGQLNLAYIERRRYLSLIKKHPSSHIVRLIGREAGDEVIHRDNLVIYERDENSKADAMCADPWAESFDQSEVYNIWFRPDPLTEQMTSKDIQRSIFQGERSQ